MGRRSDHDRDELFELTVQAGQKILAKKGLEGVTARNVAGAIGYSPGTIYNLFDNLDGLLFEINSRTFDDLVDRLRSVPAQTDVVEHLIAFAVTYLEFVSSAPHSWEAIFFHNASHKAPASLLEKIEAPLKIVEEVLARLPKPLSQDELRLSARVLWSSVHGICLLVLSDKLGTISMKSVEPLIRALIENYIAGLTA